MHLYLLIIALLLPVSTLSLPGDLRWREWNNQLEESLKFAMKVYNERSNCPYYVINTSIGIATSKLIGDINSHIYIYHGVKMATSTCKKNEDFDPDICTVAAKPEVCVR